MSELTAFLLAQLDADEAVARKLAETVGADWWVDGPAENSGRWWIYDLGVKFGSKHEADFIASHSPARVLVEVEAKRAIVEWHKNWPVLVETQPEVEQVDSADPSSFAFRASQQIAWMAEREYVARFGTEPPSSPILRILATVYADRPGFDETWRP